MIPDKTELLKDSYNFFQLETLIESDEVCLLSLLNEVNLHNKPVFKLQTIIKKVEPEFSPHYGYPKNKIRLKK